jgi:MoaA/NifB/PqqE/SkfB family radical SAM enzyme
MGKTGMYFINNIFTFYNEIHQIKNGDMPIPRMAIVYPSAKCNQNCGYCFYKKYNNGHVLDYDKHVVILQQLQHLGVKSVEWCGLGDPLLMSNPVEVFETAKNLGLRTGMLTNGLLFTGAVMERFIDYGTYIRISLDTVNAGLYEKIRGSDTLHIVLDNIKEALKYKLKKNSKCQISIKIGVSENIGFKEIQEVYDYFKDADIASIQVKHLWNEKGKHLNKQINKGNVKELDEHGMKKVIKKLFPQSQKMREQCWINPVQITIDADGNCYLCCYYMDRDKQHCFGNIFTKSLQDIWYSQDHVEAMMNIKKHECDKHDCRFKNYINVVNSEIKNGNWYFI